MAYIVASKMLIKSLWIAIKKQMKTSLEIVNQGKRTTFPPLTAAQGLQGTLEKVGTTKAG